MDLFSQNTAKHWLFNDIMHIGATHTKLYMKMLRLSTQEVNQNALMETQ